MKLNELMIGDLFRDKHTKRTIKIDSMFDEFVNIDASFSEIYAYIPLEHIEPIPLTEEILKTNGFTYTPRGYHLGIYKLKLYLDPIRKGQSGKRTQTIEFYKSIDGSQIIMASVRGIRRSLYGSIQYVHELQQAFRVCELYDLADNFKIE